MAYQEVTRTGYGDRLKRALGGVVGGAVMFIGGTALLFWNEGNFVKTKKALNEAQDAVVQVEQVTSLDPALEGKLIHASARAETQDVLEDAEFGVKQTAIQLRRSVEYYQWVEESRTETRDRMGGGEERVTTYTYKKEWRSKPVDSGEFRDPDYQNRNTVWMTFDAQTSYAKNVSFGAYTLPQFFVEAIGQAEHANVNPAPGQIQAWAKSMSAHPRFPRALSSTNTPPIHVSGNTVYFGRSPGAPVIGDVRVSFTWVAPHEVSIIGKVSGKTFVKFVAKNGKTVSRLDDGVRSAEEMFASAAKENAILTWILRLVGVLCVCIGLKSIFGILEAIAKVIPILGDIVGAGVGLVCTLVGLAWSFLWISIAWLAYRPLIGIPLLVASVGCVVWLKTKAKAKEVRI
ncbi:MAG TPA: TMEM43 family protein [Kiritimatiellia bacterium]|nr:TMEM43 family protein [Kiritimatiellia bacterium]